MSSFVLLYRGVRGETGGNSNEERGDTGGEGEPVPYWSPEEPFCRAVPKDLRNVRREAEVVDIVDPRGAAVTRVPETLHRFQGGHFLHRKSSSDHFREVRTFLAISGCQVFVFCSEM